MTAKEIILQYNKEYSVNDELLNAVKELVSDRCKEQRENCADEAKIEEVVKDFGDKYTVLVVDKDSIKNAKQPEVLDFK